MITPILFARAGELAHAWVEQRFRGHHGGLDPAECETWLGVMVRT